ncbi:2693_t:CDS:2, partial [Racocetra persica]
NREIDCVQYELLRITLQIYFDDFIKLKECYRMMVSNKISIATPTRANSCMENNPLASCFIARIKGDSIEGIYESLKDIALISKNCGRIGINVSDIRANGDYIKGSSGYSSGVCRMLRIYNEMAKYVDQGGNKHKGAIMVPELRTIDLNHCIAIPDIFMVRVRDDDYWTIFSPMDAKISLGYDLNGLYGQKFNDAYIRCEIVEYTESISICNLRAVILPNHISSENEFDFTELQHFVRLLVNSCDRSIDLTSYPLSECEIVNKSDQPIAVGVIGLAHCIKNSAREHGLYDNYEGSSLSKGILQYDMCDSDPFPELDWSSLKQRIKEYGV